MFVILIQGHKVLSFRQIYFSCTRIRHELVYPAKSIYDIMRILSGFFFYITNVGITRLVHDIPQFSILFLKFVSFTGG